MRDIYSSVFMLSLLAVTILGFLARSLLRGRARNARSDAFGGSLVLGKVAMDFGYWLMDPIVAALVALRITPNMVTGFSLVPAFGAGVALAFGWFGLACMLATVGSLCDLVDGVLARRIGVASDAGEVLDAAVDRYVELFFLGGLVIYYREYWIVLLLVLAAILGAFMISYSTAKAEAMGVPPPRGAMRRGERAVYLILAASLTPVTKVIFVDSPSHALRELPIILAVTIVAAVANVSAVQRLGAIVQALRAREPAPPPGASRDSDAGADAAAGMITKRDTPAGLV
jgi:CDP-diacylglycerol--glycerol-3-phosphate 3-phosphatidyltransferase